MTFLLVFSLISFLIAFQDSKKNFFSPSVLLTVGYFVSFSLGLYYSYRINYRIGEQTILVYVVSIIAFVGTEIFLRSFVLSKRQRGFHQARYYYTFPSSVKWLSTIICLLSLFIVFLEVKRIAGLNVSGKGNFIYDYKTNTLNKELSGNRTGELAVQVEKLIKAFAYVEMYFFINNMTVGKRRLFARLKNNLYLLLPTIILFVDYWIRGTRFPIISYFLATAFMVYFLYLRHTRLTRKAKAKLIFNVFILSLVLVILFWAMKAAFGRSNNSVSMMDYLGNYFGGAPILLDLFLKDKATLSNGYIEVFSGLAISLNKIGFPIKNTSYPEFRFFPGINEVGNAYSGLRRFYHDGGIVGCILFNMLLSLILNVWQFKLRRSNNIKSIFSLIVYSSLCYVSLFQFFEDYFFCRISVGLIIEFIIYYLILKFIFSVSSRKQEPLHVKQVRLPNRSYLKN